MTKKSTYSLIGNKFGYLTLKEIIGSGKGGAIGIFECDCGESKEIAVTRVKTNRVKSCGCMAHPHKKHRRTREYNIWHGMKQRCNNPNSDPKKLYHHRGVTVCDEWNKCFDLFYEDMGPAPSDKHTLNRKWIDGVESMIYSKETCEWATDSKQAQDRGTSWTPEEDALLKKLVTDGKKISEIFDIFPTSRANRKRSLKALYKRVEKLGLNKRNNKKWTTAEDKLVIAHSNIGSSAEEIVNALKEMGCIRTTASVYERKRFLDKL